MTNQTFSCFLKLLVSFGLFFWLRILFGSSFFGGIIFGEVLRGRFLDLFLVSCYIGRMLLLAAFRKFFRLLLSELVLSSDSLSFSGKSFGFNSFGGKFFLLFSL